MPPAPSEPEKYSIDEIMERLKASPTDAQQGGQLVTRSDGSQALKVRKRKRRSSQSPKGESKSSKRARILQVSGALILLFTAALAIGTGIIYANSTPFKDKLIRDVGKASGAQVDLQQFRMNPRTANAQQLTLMASRKYAEKSGSRPSKCRDFPVEFHRKIAQWRGDHRQHRQP